MQRARRMVGLLAVGVSLCVGLEAQTAGTPHSFRAEGDHFVLDGKPFEVIAGEMHYARIPREYWKQRIEMAKAMGLNTIATYVFWNVHEPQPGHYNFSGNADLAAFLRLAQEEHMYVLLRAGPYSCAEWEFGGFPAWLLKDPRMSHALRANDPAFLKPVAAWMKRLGQEIGRYQIENGGPIIATQIENEYGNFSSDATYMKAVRDIFVRSGFTKSMLYTVDPSKALARGEIDGVVSGVNFGTGRAGEALDILAKERTGGPLFATEYWPGWFDLWGHPHETRPLAPQLKDLDTMLNRGASLNIYMFHGGTNWGMMAGASQSTGSYRGNVTSYDYDAPLDEAGHTTKKFFAYRDEILKYTHEKPLPVPAVPPVITVAPFMVEARASLWDYLPKPVQSEHPRTMEELGQSYGYILYRKQIDHAMKDELLELDHPYDYVQVYLDGKLAGTLDRHYNQTSLKLNSAGPTRLDVLVENTGRLNSTRWMRDERKGIRGATLAGKELLGWSIYSLPMENVAWVKPEMKPEANFARGPHYSAGTFTVQSVGDTFLDVRSLGKGLVWINGHPIGRVWNIGPQDTLYVPGPWLQQGKNTVVVFDLFAGDGKNELAGLAAPILDGPTPTYAGDPERRKKEDKASEFGSKLGAAADAKTK